MWLQEQPLDPGLYPGPDAADSLCPGAMVFVDGRAPVDLETGGNGGTGCLAPAGISGSAISPTSRLAAAGWLSGPVAYARWAGRAPEAGPKVGVRGPWRNRGNLAVGRPGEAGGTCHNEHLAEPGFLTAATVHWAGWGPQ